MAILIQDTQEFENRIDRKFDHLESSLIEKLRKEFQPKAPEEFLTRAETANLLKVTVVTVDRWTEQAKLTRYCLGNRILYKRSEIESSITLLD